MGAGSRGGWWVGGGGGGGLKVRVWWRWVGGWWGGMVEVGGGVGMVGMGGGRVGGAIEAAIGVLWSKPEGTGVVEALHVLACLFNGYIGYRMHAASVVYLVRTTFPNLMITILHVRSLRLICG